MSAKRTHGAALAAVTSRSTAAVAGRRGELRAGVGRPPARRCACKPDPCGALRLDKKTLAAKAGKVTLVMRNPAPLSHDVSIQGPGINEHGEVVGKGGTTTVAATLKAGTYTFYCRCQAIAKGDGRQR